MLQLLCKVWLWMDLFSAANIFLKLRDDLTVSKRRKHLFLRIFRLFCISSGKKRCNFKTSFSKLVHRKGCFGEIKKNRFFGTDFRFLKYSGGFPWVRNATKSIFKVFCFKRWRSENWVFCIRYFSKMKHKSTKPVTQQCFSCQNKSVCQKLALDPAKFKIALFAQKPSFLGSVQSAITA